MSDRPRSTAVPGAGSRTAANARASARRSPVVAMPRFRPVPYGRAIEAATAPIAGHGW
ncbi:hypothetical protein [Nocardia sp. NPDC057227]|uniref:hypothetical protein n=1 Tax=Nocardia sp. NPDC057227 TaxID=3346056 RepID=UPI00362BA807